MARLRKLIALAATAWCGPLSASLYARPDQPFGTPPPPPEIYDPVPGPFIAVVDERGNPQDAGVIENAIQSWSGSKASAFYLCYQTTAKPMNWEAVVNALSNVSRELKTLGAIIVVVDGRRLCSAPPSASAAGKSYVEITGVIRD